MPRPPAMALSPLFAAVLSRIHPSAKLLTSGLSDFWAILLSWTSAVPLVAASFTNSLSSWFNVSLAAAAGAARLEGLGWLVWAKEGRCYEQSDGDDGSRGGQADHDHHSEIRNPSSFNEQLWARFRPREGWGEIPGFSVEWTPKVRQGKWGQFSRRRTGCPDRPESLAGS